MSPIFRTEGYRRLWLNAFGNALSKGGDFVLIGWMALTVTSTSAWVGTAFALYYLPLVVLGIPAGGFADRFDRRRLIQALELVSALVIGLFALLFWLNGVVLVLVLAFTLCLGSLRAVHTPVRLSFTYDLVGPRMITPALAGMTLGVRFGMLAGALVIGTLAEKIGLVFALVLMIAAHLAAWLCLASRIESGASRSLERQSVLANLKGYLSELKANHVLLALTLVTAAIEIFGTSLHTVLPELAETRLSLGVEGLGWMSAAQACGGIAAGLLIFLIPQRRGKIVAYTASLLCLAAGLIFLGAAPGLASVLIALAITSGMVTAWDIFTQSMMQLCVGDGLRGRAMGTWVFAIGSAPLGHLQIGFLAAAFGVDIALYANGLAVAAIIVVALLITPALRRL